jgi:hypothetical protein
VELVDTLVLSTSPYWVRVRVSPGLQNLNNKEMGKSRKRVQKSKSHSSILKNKKRMAENYKVLEELKESK